MRPIQRGRGYPGFNGMRHLKGCSHLVPDQGTSAWVLAQNGGVFWVHTLSKYPISNCVHSYSLPPRQTPFIKLELSREKQCGIALEQIKTVRTQGSCALLSGRAQGLDGA